MSSNFDLLIGQFIRETSDLVQDLIHGFIHIMWTRLKVYAEQTSVTANIIITITIAITITITLPVLGIERRQSLNTVSFGDSRDKIAMTVETTGHSALPLSKKYMQELHQTTITITITISISIEVTHNQTKE